MTDALANHPNVTLVRERVDALPEGPAILATARSTAPALAEAIGGATGAEALAFFDALAPIVYRDFRSTWTWPGSPRAGTRARPRITSTAR